MSQVETTFDQIVGAIEDIVIDDQFQDLQTELLEKHFHHFDVSTEKNTLHKLLVPKELNSNFFLFSELGGEQANLH